MPPTPCGRPRDGRARTALGLAAGIAVPAALLGGTQATALPALPAPAVPASSAAEQQPVCGDLDAAEFPIETRIQDAPDRYASGGGYGTWVLELTNTSAAPCRALHPVLVLADRDRRLTADQIQLEFTEPGRSGAVHRVTWETTDRDEQIGVFGGVGGKKDTEGAEEVFLGFTVPVGKTVSVRVRMAFTSDTAPGPVTAHAAVVQRRHQDKAKGGGREDGDWVGESEAYPFVIADGATGGIREPEPPEPERPRPERPEPRPPRSKPPEAERTGPGDPDSPRTTAPDTEAPRAEAGAGEEPAPGRTIGAHPPTRPGSGDGGRDGGEGDEEHPGLPVRDGAERPLPELARTGPASLSWAGAAAGALVLGGAGLVLHARRLRRTTG
ncbi:peptidase [Streptomyces pratensis]|uniref:peptidase n=1 Tax=Streptomyces pratensis TaxID=1169025 RepID=UPI003017C68F